MDTFSPVLSIIIPSNGRQDSLNSLLEELYSQAITSNNKDRIEVIVIDDGTQPPLEPLGTRSPVKTLWLRLETNSGAPSARKLGFGHSRGPFVHFHDSDDSIAQGWLPYLLDKLEKLPDIDFLLSGRIIQKDNSSEVRKQHFVKKFQKHANKIAFRLKFDNCFGPLGGVTFSRRSVEKMRFNDLKSCQDWDMYLDAIDSNSVIVQDENFFFIKNETSTARISSHINKKVLGILKFRRIHNTEISNCDITKLFYIHCVKRDFQNGQHTLFNSLYKKRWFRIFLSSLIVKIIKLRALI